MKPGGRNAETLRPQRNAEEKGFLDKTSPSKRILLVNSLRLSAASASLRFSHHRSLALLRLNLETESSRRLLWVLKNYQAMSAR